MIKLYNLSGLPDEPLREILAKAKRLTGARGDVIVKVTRGGGQVTSNARAAAWVYRWFLESRHRTKRSAGTELKRGRVKTDGGYVVMQPYHPPPHALRNPAWSAEWKQATRWAELFFETAIHEFYHVKEYQQGGRYRLAWSSRGTSGRRPEHDKRPEEIRAQNATEEILGRIKGSKGKREAIDRLLLKLAAQMAEKWSLPAASASASASAASEIL